MACVLMLMVALTGCSSGTNTPENQPQPENTSANDQKSNESGKEEENKQQTVVDKKELKADLKFLSPWGFGYEEQFNNVFADFMKVYPNIKVELLEQNINDLPALVAAGMTPDLIMMFNTVPAWREDKFVEDLAPYIEMDPDVDPSLFYKPAFDGYVEDGVWGLPLQDGANLLLVYHKDILDQYGYTEFPELNSLEEINDFFQKFWVTDNGKQEMTTFAPHESIGSTRNTLQTWAYANGATTKTFYDPETRKANFNDPLIVEALEWMVRFKNENIDEKRLSELQASLPENTNRFQAGKQLMQPEFSTTVVNRLKENPDLGVTTMPLNSLWFGGWGMGMTSGGKNKDAAWELVKWMTSTNEGAESLLKHFGWLSAKIENPYLVEQAKTNPALKVAYEAMKEVKHSHLESLIPVDYFPEFDDKWPKVMDGSLSPKAFLDHMTEYIQELIDKKYGK
ncbi:extracellular solute-binding protein [Paenibacillus spongiae]|uniref:Extracellular solute-binding protein n=1 Tax=Paenibacillus spongiae TaxID=2909671 RepID=A0ABY5SM51_9BACL|nr:extracellular solute-binding protein [Paenibacillus spongiae]UVI33298.1 extracellular solute-binding protein [Paenibacillus spongiae]